MYHPFSVAETVKTAWKVLKENFATFVIYSIVTLVLGGVINFLSVFLIIEDTVVSEVLIGLLQLLLQSYLALSFYKLILTLMDKQYYEFEFKEIWPSFKMATQFLIVVLFYILLIILLGYIDFALKKYDAIVFILEIIELVLFCYLLVRSIFCICFIVDDNSGAIESLKQSYAITKDNFFKTLSIFIIAVAIMILILIPIVILVSLMFPHAERGSFVFTIAFYLWFVIAFPSVQVLVMVAYRKLVYSHLDVDDDIAETN